MSVAKFYMKNWMEFIDIDILKSRISGRTVYAWNDKQYDVLERFLNCNGIELKGCINGNKELVNNSIYIIAALSYRDADIMAEFIDAGLKEDVDFTYIGTYKELSAVSGYYKDNCGNEVICEGEARGLNVQLQGYNNKLYIGKDFCCGSDCQIRLKGNAKVRFGRGFYAKNGKMFFRNSESIFEGNSYIADNFFISNFEGYMNIGEGMTVTDSLYICVVENTKLIVGKDCLVAKDVKILSGGAHSLFDLDLKENINIKDNVHVTIGNHVWLGMDSKIIYNTDIGDNCIVGAGSIVKGVYPSHCLMAGSIARVLRTNVDWEHEDYVTYEEYEEMHRE